MYRRGIRRLTVLPHYRFFPARRFAQYAVIRSLMALRAAVDRRRRRLRVPAEDAVDAMERASGVRGVLSWPAIFRSSTISA